MTAAPAAAAVPGGNAALLTEAEATTDAPPGGHDDLLLQKIKQVLEEHLDPLQRDIHGIKKSIDSRNHSNDATATDDDDYDQAAHDCDANKKKKEKNNNKTKKKSAQEEHDNGSRHFKWVGTHHRHRHGHFLNLVKWDRAAAAMLWFMLGILVSRGPWPFLDHGDGVNNVRLMMGNVHLAAAQPVMDPAMIPGIPVMPLDEEEEAEEESAEGESPTKLINPDEEAVTVANPIKLLADKMNRLRKMRKSRMQKMARKFSSSRNRELMDLSQSNPRERKRILQDTSTLYYYPQSNGKTCTNDPAGMKDYFILGVYSFESLEECCASEW